MTICRPMPLRASAFIVLGMASFCAATLDAATLKVDPQQGGQPGIYDSIPEALSVANNGDVIEVVPGTYFGAIALSGKTLTLRSTEGADKTKLADADNILTISTTPTAGTSIEGFTFEGATQSAVRVLAATATLRSNRFIDNGTNEAGRKGGAVFASSANAVILEDNVFSGNTAELGGAIGSTNSVRLTLRRNVFQGNDAVKGGAAAIDGETEVIWEGNFFCNNAAVEGGAIWQTGGIAVIESGAFQGNESDTGGALWLSGVEGLEDGPALVANAVFMGNIGAVSARLAFVAGSAVAWVNDVFIDVSNGAIASDSTTTSDFNAFAGDTAGWVAGAEIELGSHSLAFGTVDELELRSGAETCGPPMFEPTPSSPLINKGDPARKDAYDNSRSDIGAYGGPAGVAPATDTDGDEHPDLLDNCPGDLNANQLDSDDDGLGDVCDETPGVSNDPDKDGVSSESDNCPNFPNPDQTDSDQDGKGNPCDPNDDDDPVPDQDDCAPLDPAIYPGQQEICNELDDNCNELIDENITCIAEPDGGSGDDSSDGDTAGGEGGADVGGGGDATAEGGGDSGGGGGGCSATPSSRPWGSAAWLVALLWAGGAFWARRRTSRANGR